MREVYSLNHRRIQMVLFLSFQCIEVLVGCIKGSLFVVLHYMSWFILTVLVHVFCDISDSSSLFLINHFVLYHGSFYLSLVSFHIYVG